MNPSIVLGTFQNNNYQDLLNVVDAAFEKGCTAFDTAPSYGTETDSTCTVENAHSIKYMSLFYVI